MADDKTSDHQPLLLDEVSQRLERFHVLASSDDAAADQLLNDLGGSGRVEHDMLLELAANRPLAHPERFVEAHAVAMHALEVLARNGTREPSQLTAGPFTGLARPAVQQVITYLVRSHQTHMINSIRDLYTRRLAWIPTRDSSRLPLVRARLDVERASSAYKKSGGGLPTFLVGGAAASSLAQIARTGASATAGSRAGVVIAVLVAFVLLAAASWAILRGAAIARRRIRLTLDGPMGALWETIGWCGHPPRDAARSFALIAIGLTALCVVVIPLGVLAFTLA